MLVLRVELMRRIGLSGASTGQKLHQKLVRKSSQKHTSILGDFRQPSFTIHLYQM